MAVTISVGATDALGATATATVTATQSAATGTIPLSYNDARFNSNTASTNVAGGSGLIVTKKSITDTGDVASIYCQGSATIDTCRVNSREGVRVGGPGLVSITNCYLEATGIGADHADVIQAYAPNSTGTIMIRTTAIAAHPQNATAGLWIADGYQATVDLKDVVFIGGPYGFRAHPDGGDNFISLENVYFVGPFAFGAIYLGDTAGHHNVIVKWINVRNATIVNGVLVPGTAIPPGG